MDLKLAVLMLTIKKIRKTVKKIQERKAVLREREMSLPFQFDCCN